MTVVGFRRHPNGITLCDEKCDLGQQLTNNEKTTVVLLESLSYRLTLQEQNSDEQSGEVIHNDFHFPTIQSLVNYAQIQSEENVLQGTAIEIQNNNNDVERLLEGNEQRRFRFTFIVSEKNLCEYVIGLKQDNQPESLSQSSITIRDRRNDIYLTCTSRQENQTSDQETQTIEQPAQLKQPTAGDADRPIIGAELDSKVVLIQECIPKILFGLQEASESQLIQFQQEKNEVETPKMGLLSENFIDSQVSIDDRDYAVNLEHHCASDPFSSLQKNVFFQSSHVESDLGDQLSVCDRRSKSPSSKVSAQEVLNRKFNSIPVPKGSSLVKSYSQQMLNKFSDAFKLNQEEQLSSNSRGLNSPNPLKNKKKFSNSQLSKKGSERCTDEVFGLKSVNTKLIEQVNQLKAQIETNKIFTFMVIHDLKHPTESLIDSLQFVMNNLKRLEKTLTTLKLFGLDIQGVNDGMQKQLLRLCSQLSLIDNPRELVSLSSIFEDATLQRRQGNHSQRHQVSHLQSDQIAQAQRIQSEIRVPERAISGFVDDSQQISSEEGKLGEQHSQVQQIEAGNQVNFEGNQARARSDSEDSTGIVQTDFEEGNLGSTVKNMTQNTNIHLFQLAGKGKQRDIINEIAQANILRLFHESQKNERISKPQDRQLKDERNYQINSGLLSPCDLGQAVNLNFGVNVQDNDLIVQEVRRYVTSRQQSSVAVQVSLQNFRLDSEVQHLSQQLGPSEQISRVVISSASHGSSIQNDSSVISFKRDLTLLQKDQVRTQEKQVNLLHEIEVSLNQISKAIDTVTTLNYTSEMMRNLMMDLLDLAQMEKNTFKLNKDFFSIFEVIQQAFNLVSHVSNKKNVVLKSPEVTDPIERQLYLQIYGDKNRFLQVIINFLSNSLKFSENGSQIHLHLKLLENQVLQNSEFMASRKQFKRQVSTSQMQPATEEMKGDETPSQNKSLGPQKFGRTLNSQAPQSSEKTSYIEFMLSIQDFGIGIPEDKINSLFINFGNLEEHQKTNPTGRGLGLSICKSIVEQMGGKVLVESELGKGSTFSMTFKVMCKIPDPSQSNSHSLRDVGPLSSKSLEFKHSALQTSLQNQRRKENGHSDDFLQSRSDNPVNKPRLLLVNDTQYLLMAYEMQLEDTFIVQTAENGLQALQIVTSEPVNYFDVILLDINMPIMDGFEACLRITDYLYQAESMFSMQSKARFTSHNRPKLSDSDLQSSQNQLIKSQSHVMLGNIFSQNWNVQSRKSKTSFNHSDKAESFHDNESNQKMQPLIYALTGDLSKQTMEKINTYPFMGVFEKIGMEESKFIIEQIENRQDAYKHKNTKQKQKKRRPRPALSQNNLSLNPQLLAQNILNQSIEELNVILEDDEGMLSSSNSVSSGEENAVDLSNSCKVVLDQSDKSEIAVPYQNKVQRGVNVKQIQKVVNFIRKQSSQKNLSFFRPLAESNQPYDQIDSKNSSSIQASQSLQIDDFGNQYAIELPANRIQNKRNQSEVEIKLEHSIPSVLESEGIFSCEQDSIEESDLQSKELNLKINVDNSQSNYDSSGGISGLVSDDSQIIKANVVELFGPQPVSARSAQGEFSFSENS